MYFPDPKNRITKIYNLNLKKKKSIENNKKKAKILFLF